MSQLFGGAAGEIPWDFSESLTLDSRQTCPRYMHSKQTLTTTKKDQRARFFVYPQEFPHICLNFARPGIAKYHRENGGSLGMVPSIINLIYTLFYILGIYWVYNFFLKGSNRGAFKQLGYPKNPQKIDLHLSWGGTYRKGLPVAELGVYTLPADGRPAKPTLSGWEWRKKRRRKLVDTNLGALNELGFVDFLRFRCSHGKSCFTTVWENMCGTFFQASKQANPRRGSFFFQPPKWLLRGTTYLDKQKARLIHHLEMMKHWDVFLLFVFVFGVFLIEF